MSAPNDSGTSLAAMFLDLGMVPDRGVMRLRLYAFLLDCVDAFEAAQACEAMDQGVPSTLNQRCWVLTGQLMTADPAALKAALLRFRPRKGDAINAIFATEGNRGQAKEPR